MSTSSSSCSVSPLARSATRRHSTVFASKLKFFTSFTESESSFCENAPDLGDEILSSSHFQSASAPGSGSTSGARARAHGKGARSQRSVSMNECDDTFTKSPSMSNVMGFSSTASSASSSIAMPTSISRSTTAPAKADEALLSRMRSPSTVIRSKTNVCVICQKAAYPTESIKVDQLSYHKRCFKCEHCKCRLTMGGFAMINTNAYCKPHFKQLFQSSGGKYDRAFGSIWNNTSDPKARSNTVIRKSYAPPVEGVFSGTAESITSPTNRNRSATERPRSGSKTLPRSIRLNPKKAMTAPASKQQTLSKPKNSFEAPPAAPTNASEPKKKSVTLTAKSAPADKAKSVKTKKKVTIDLPPPPTEAPPPEPKQAKHASSNGVSSSSSKLGKKDAKSSAASAKAEDPVAAFFRALKSNNPKTLATALAALAANKNLGVVVSPSAQLTNMTPVEYAYVTRKIPAARVLVNALKGHFDAL